MSDWTQVVVTVVLTVVAEALVDYLVDTFKVSRRSGKSDRHSH